jgi:response regulator RpfG family c-di-GMP phosphodiesterase
MADLNLACVLVDQFMPVMDGWGFLAAVRGNPAMANLPVILISAAEAERPEGVPSDVNFDNVLLKPIRHQELADYLQRRLHLEWLLDHADVRPSSGTTAETETPGHCYQLTGQQIADFKDMLALGRIVAIRHWAEQLAAVQPELGDFAAEVMRLVESVDLAGLARLLAQVEADAAKPAD